ncbi:unnamed protein product [Pylaiella littoralis]
MRSSTIGYVRECAGTPPRPCCSVTVTAGAPYKDVPTVAARYRLFCRDPFTLLALPATTLPKSARNTTQKYPSLFGDPLPFDQEEPSVRSSRASTSTRITYVLGTDQ